MKQLVNIISVAFIIAILFPGCDNVTTSFGLTIGSTSFNRLNENGEFELVQNGKFDNGEVVYLMMFDVSGFEKGPDGKHQVEMDMEITDMEGNVILETRELLGENGHVELDNGIAANPNASFSPGLNTPDGDYKFYAKIYDKVGGGSASVTKKFTLR
ncbi:MAG: hypothetical protein ABIJ16_13945 [Bacteroidota bacterium]